MDTLASLFHYILHVDQYLIAFVFHYGAWAYIILFAIIFCETGLIIMPFLPGDSLLFAAGSIAAHATKALNIQLLFVTLIIASLLGNKVNYFVGKWIGPYLFKPSPTNTWKARLKSVCFKQKHLTKAQQFYDRHGGKTIILARFIPVIRSFVPFVAGMSGMDIKRFSFFNILSSFIWIGSLLGLGYYLGTLTIVKENFSLFIYAIIAASLLPTALAYLYHKYYKAFS